MIGMVCIQFGLLLPQMILVLQNFCAVYLCIMSSQEGQQLGRTYFEVPF